MHWIFFLSITKWSAFLREKYLNMDVYDKGYRLRSNNQTGESLIVCSSRIFLQQNYLLRYPETKFECKTQFNLLHDEFLLELWGHTLMPVHWSEGVPRLSMWKLPPVKPDKKKYQKGGLRLICNYWLFKILFLKTSERWFQLKLVIYWLTSFQHCSKLG